MKTKTVLVWNRIPQAKERIREQVEGATVAAAESLRDFIAQALESGNFDIASDTGALANSLYVAATGRNDYGEALDAARKAFKENASAYRNTAPKNADDLFSAIVAGREELPNLGAHVFVCAVSTMLAYGNYHETHDRPWMQPAALAWANGQGRATFERLRIK